MKVRFTRPALIDIAEIEAWIAQDKPEAARRMADRLLAAGFDLNQSHRRYRRLWPGKIRIRVVEGYVLLYRVLDEVQVLRVMHGSRDWQSLIETL